MFNGDLSGPDSEICVRFYTHPCPGKTLCVETAHYPITVKFPDETQARRFAWAIYCGEFVALAECEQSRIGLFEDLGQGRIAPEEVFGIQYGG